MPQFSKTLTTLVSFTSGADGAAPYAGLIADAAGNLYGTTSNGGSANYGTVFEVAKGATAATALATFTGTNGANPVAGLIADAAGNLYGTTSSGGSANDGTVFELAKGATAITTLATFTGANGANPKAGLTVDAAGNLYGTTEGGGSAGDGTVFKLAKGAAAVTTLATFNGANGNSPAAGLIADAAGNLYGTTGITGESTVFELAKGATAVTTLATFTGANGAFAITGLTADAAGNLYGTTLGGGSGGNGTVFELAKGATAVTTLASFTSGTATGDFPYAGLTADAAGNLYGTTETGGSNDQGTVFELAKGATAVTTLASFTYYSGTYPMAGLIADAAGNLYGTTPFGGGYDEGTVFELSVVIPAPTLVDTSVASKPAKPVLSGIAQADATVRIYDATQLVGTTLASDSGAWSLGLSAALTAGTHTLSATATDAAGNISPTSTPLGVVVGSADNYTVNSAPDAAGVTTARLYDASSILVEIDLSNASGQLLQSVNGTTAALNIYDTAGTLIGTITQPSSGVTSQPVFGTTAQNQAATTSTGMSSSQVTLLAESNIITTQGSDTVTAGSGSDTIYALGAATSVVGGSGSLLFMADAGSSTVTGGSGSSTLLGGAGGGYLEGGGLGRNVLVSNGGNATLVGGGLGDTLVGAAGQAVVVAGDGGTAFGGSGSATIFGGNGVMVGGTGSNLMVADAHSNEAEWASGGTSTLFGGGGRDTLAGGGGTATMVGGSGNTLFVGGAGRAVAFGGSGDDTFIATGGGAVIIVEGDGSDEVLLGAGTSSVFGGTGTDLYDVVHGGAGGVNVISGFKTGSDQIRLFGYDPETVAQSVVGGSLMLNLADGTRITLVGVTHLGANALV